MAKRAELPAVVHDHFQKANRLHTYVEKHLGEATQHALETGKELLAAKAAVPHGRWEDECKRLFDGSLRTAQFYMQFSKNMGAIKSAQKSAILMLEGTLDGAAKAAKKAAKPTPPKPPKDTPRQDAPPPDSQPDYGKCPNCLGTKWTEDDDGVACAKCHHPHGEPAGDPDEDRVKTQRQKTVKTVEALQRAFDDMNALQGKGDHGGATKWVMDDVVTTLRDMGVVAACKGLLRIGREWK